jgi:hypothetical protein
MDSGAEQNMKVRNKAVWGSGIRLLLALLAVASSASCGDLQRQGTGASYLIVESLVGASGAKPDELDGTIHSDVITVVDDVPTIFNDLGEVTLRLAMKDPGITEPSTTNFITINRYRVRYIRADGRNTPGVDIPYGFDGGITVTVGTSGAVHNFEIVRHTAKSEAPLAALAASGVIIATIAEVTFYGRDQDGREVIAMGRISINFGNFGDPE